MNDDGPTFEPENDNATQAPTSVSDPTEAIKIILAPMSKGNALSHGWLGDRGQGKSLANVELIEIMLRAKLLDVVFTIDDKTAKGTPYKGTQRATVEQYLEYPDSGSKHIVFRGSAYRRDYNDVVEIGDVASLAWDTVRVGPFNVLVNVDELSDATPGQGQAWKKSAAPVAAIFRKGRGAGVSITWTTQLPQTLPLEAFGLSETMGIFRMDGREVAYLIRKNVLEPELQDIVPSLDIGQWILYRKGRGGWNGKIYKFKLGGK